MRLQLYPRLLPILPLKTPLLNSPAHLALLQLSPSSPTPSLHLHSRQISRPSSSSGSQQPPLKRSRGPVSSETTQTDFASLDMLGNVPAPTTAINACLEDGFHLNSGLRIDGGSGCLLVAGEAFRWRPWLARNQDKIGGTGRSMLNRMGQWEVPRDAWGLLELVWPKPDLLILGLGPSMHPISQQTKRDIISLGIWVDVQDTRNAAAQFNLLATERGVKNVAAALIPMGRREPKR